MQNIFNENIEMVNILCAKDLPSETNGIWQPNILISFQRADSNGCQTVGGGRQHKRKKIGASHECIVSYNKQQISARGKRQPEPFGGTNAKCIQ